MSQVLLAVAREAHQGVSDGLEEGLRGWLDCSQFPAAYTCQGALDQTESFPTYRNRGHTLLVLVAVEA